MSNVEFPGEELPLLKKIGDSLELDYDVLLSVLTHPSIGDRPISIVSIAGALRTGKSFMLNFFLRYLQNKGYQNDWLGDPSIPLKDGIQWRGGLQPNTFGINIWSEPFIVEKGGKEIAVILLDTQGNDDHADSRINDVKVFVISVLLSSTFIYNVKYTIEHHDLEYLQYFIEFATAIKESKGTKARFQSLRFLVRDWDNEKDYPLGQRGGEDYLKSVLDTEEESSLKKYLRTAFETANCYLMPMPEIAVRQADSESSITLADIEPRFREHISQLVECLLNPQSLIVKKIGNDDVNGRRLAIYIADCWEKLIAGGLPTSVGRMELTAQANCRKFIDQGEETCKNVISKMHKSYVPDERIQEIKQEAMDAALKMYDENVNYGGENIKQTFRRMLENVIKQQFTTLHETNETYKVITEAILRATVTECLDNYTDSVLKQTREKWTDELKLYHETYFNEAMKAFNIVSDKTSCEQLVNPYKEKLVEKLNQMYTKLEKDNERYEEDAKKSFENLLSKAVTEHKNCLKSAIATRSVSDGDFMTFHEKGIEEAMIRYSTCCDIVCPDSIKEEYSMEKLLHKIEENKQMLWLDNESVKEAENDATFKKAKEDLYDLMKKEFDGEITEETTIEKKCKDFSKKVLKSLKPGESFMPKWEKEVERIIQSYSGENKILQDSTKQKLHEETTRIENEFQRKCEEKLAVDGKYIEEDELQRFIDFKMKDLIETSNQRENVATVEMRSKFRQDVEKLLEEKTEEIIIKNAENKIGYRFRLEQQLRKFRFWYISNMKQKWDEAYIEPEVLYKFHKKLMKEVSNDLSEQRSSLTVFTEHEKEVKKQLTSLYVTIQGWNEENKPLRKKVISAIGGLGIVGSMAVDGLLKFRKSKTALTSMQAIRSMRTPISAIRSIVQPIAAIGPTGVKLSSSIVAVEGVAAVAGVAAVVAAFGYVIFSRIQYEKMETEKDRVKKEAAVGVSFGEIDSTGGIMGCNDCVVEVPSEAITKGGKIQLDLSTSFQSKQSQKTYFAITPLFRCDPAVPKFLKEVTIELPTWCSTTSKDIFVYVKENNEKGESFKKKEINFKDVSDYIIKFKTSHFNDLCCFMKLSQIGMCSIRLSLHVFIDEKHNVIVVFHLADTTVQNACEIALVKSGLFPNLAEIESFPVKHGESVKMSLWSLGNAIMGEAYSMNVVVDNEFIRKGYTWKIFNLPNLKIRPYQDTKLTYILNGEKKDTGIESVNFQNSDATIEDDLAIN